MKTRITPRLFWKLMPYVIISIGAVIMMMPFVWMVSTAFHE